MDTTSFIPGLQSVELSVSDSKISFGRFLPKEVVGIETLMSYPLIAAGLSAIVAQRSYSVLLSINNVTALANNGILLYGNLFFHCNRNSLTIHLHKINSCSNGRGLSLEIDTSLITSLAQCEIPKQHSIQMMAISQSSFSHNARAVNIHVNRVYC